jgi:dTDP-4-dehydrorhamnose reductase
VKCSALFIPLVGSCPAVSRSASEERSSEAPPLRSDTFPRYSAGRDFCSCRRQTVDWNHVVLRSIHALASVATLCKARSKRMRVLITGASGKLGTYLLSELQSTGHDVIAWSGGRRGTCFGCTLESVDLANPPQITAAFQTAKPDVVIHTAAQSSVGACYNDPECAQQVNVAGSKLLAELASTAGSRFLFVSTDMVFDGNRGNYCERDAVRPLSIYGKSKASAESEVLKHGEHAVVRVTLLFGPTLIERPAFFDEMVVRLRQQRKMQLFHDEWRTPLSLKTAGKLLWRTAESDVGGLMHLGGPERMSRLEMGERLAAHVGLSPSNLVSASIDSVAAAEPRPRDLSFNSGHWQSHFPNAAFPQYEDALAEMGLGAA